jgi:uncharacterized membrane protein YqaE (UPF0057 family)
MPTPDPYNITAKDPEDYIYISKKHWARKQNVENNDQLGGIIGRPGPITGLVLSIIDIVLYFILRFVFYIFDITQYAFGWINNMTFGNFQGILPRSLIKGKVISTKFFRYTMNVLMPPFGVMLSKGIYGWFNILVCMLLTYVFFLAGIIYAFIITSRNRYADQYEMYQLKKFEKLYPPEEANQDITAFLSTIGFVVLIGIIFFLCFSFF